jgi:hypothetical protein
MDYLIRIYGYKNNNKIKYHASIFNIVYDDKDYIDIKDIYMYTYKILEEYAEPLLSDYGYEIKECFNDYVSLTMEKEVIKNVLGDIICDILNCDTKSPKNIWLKFALIKTTTLK